ncbi:HNH endonuclease [Glutamicibacter sp.]|uniref:HNH endonuclease signature motif containing protein n=1 Tax=Glutamicibacter sp. TaxID=1931995 RepID=UPI0028BEAB12|nr:HNH endonuclease [Glutamicibacter sp.]
MNSAAALVDLARAEELLTGAMAQLGEDTPAGHAAYAARLIEELGKQLIRAQIRIAHTVRAVGAHKLDQPSLQSIADAGLHPTLDAAAAAAGHTTTERTHYRNAADLLAGWLALPISSVRERIAQGDNLIGQVNAAGEPLKPALGVLAKEFSNRQLDPRLILAAARKIKGARKDLGTGASARAACRELQQQALKFIAQQPATARKHINTLVAQAVGEKHSPKGLLDRAGIYRLGQRRGLEHLLIKCLPSQAEAMFAVFRAIDNPKTIAGNRERLAQLLSGLGADAATAWDDAGTMPEWARGTGKSSAAQPPAPQAKQPIEDLRPELRHLLGLLTALQSSGSDPPGLNTQIGVILDYDKMIAAGRDFAVTVSGIPVPAGEARALLCTAGIYPLVLGGASQILDLGRTQRLYSAAQARAVRTAYRGCGYPGCTMPAGRCELDHLDKWELGGRTDIDTADLYCTVHHIGRHCGLFRAVKVPGSRPMVLLPPELDSEQKLQFNTYFFGPAEALKLQRQAADATARWKAGTLQVQFAQA